MVLNPVVVRLAGTFINRHTAESLSAAGFDDVEVIRRMGGIVRLIEARP